MGSWRCGKEKVASYSADTVLSTQMNFTRDAGCFKLFPHTSRGGRALFSHSLNVFRVFLTHERSEGLLAEGTLCSQQALQALAWVRKRTLLMWCE